MSALFIGTCINLIGIYFGSKAGKKHPTKGRERTIAFIIPTIISLIGFAFILYSIIVEMPHWLK